MFLFVSITCQYSIRHGHRIMLVSVQLLETNAEFACFDMLRKEAKTKKDLNKHPSKTNLAKPWWVSLPSLVKFVFLSPWYILQRSLVNFIPP